MIPEQVRLVAKSSHGRGLSALMVSLHNISYHQDTFNGEYMKQTQYAAYSGSEYAGSTVPPHGEAGKAPVSRGWALSDGGVCRGSIPGDDYWREYLICVRPLAKGYLVEDNFGNEEGHASTLEAALSLADTWCRQELARRETYAQNVGNPRLELAPAADLVPF